MKTLLFQ